MQQQRLQLQDELQNSGIFVNGSDEDEDTTLIEQEAEVHAQVEEAISTEKEYLDREDRILNGLAISDEHEHENNLQKVEEQQQTQALADTEDEGGNQQDDNQQGVTFAFTPMEEECSQAPEFDFTPMGEETPRVPQFQFAPMSEESAPGLQFMFSPLSVVRT